MKTPDLAYSVGFSTTSFQQSHACMGWMLVGFTTPLCYIYVLLMKPVSTTYVSIIAFRSNDFTVFSLFHSFNIVFFSFKLHWIMDSLWVVMYGTWMCGRLFGCMEQRLQSFECAAFDYYYFCWYSLEVSALK